MSEEELNHEKSRRDFFTKLSLSIAGIATLGVSIPVVSALIAPLLKKPDEVWRTVGELKDFPVQSTSLVKFVNTDPAPYAGTTANSAAWLRRNNENDFIAFSANCTHLGCPVRWEKEAQLFMCPCHGGVYYKDGTVAAGPPPKPLTQYKVRVINNKVQLKTAPVPITSISASK
jgi:menaquinol-cytochrome c reductase iron-sulfur subunit